MEYYSVSDVDYLNLTRDGLYVYWILNLTRERDFLGGFCTKNQNCGAMKPGNNGTGPELLV